MSESKRCAGCGETKTLDQFYVDRSTGNTRSRCKPCANLQRREQRARQKERQESRTVHVGEMRVPSVFVEESAREEPRQAPPHISLRPYSTVVALGDIHFPWHHEGAIRQALQIVKELQPDYVVQMADLYDLYSFSRYPRSLNVMTPENELLMARGYAEALWRDVHSVSPSSKCFQLWGNHDSRAQRRTLEKLPEAEGFVARGMRDLMSFEGVNLIDDTATELIIDDVHYTHSYMSRVGATMLETNRNCVTAHLHVGGLITRGYEKEITWELGVGWLGDRRAPCFTYAGRRRSHRTTLGVGVIDSYGPRFVPFYED